MPSPHHVSRSACALSGLLGLLLLATGCGSGDDDRPAAVAHLAACVESAPDQPCEPLAGQGADYSARPAV